MQKRAVFSSAVLLITRVRWTFVAIVGALIFTAQVMGQSFFALECWVAMLRQRQIEEMAARAKPLLQAFVRPTSTG